MESVVGYEIDFAPMGEMFSFDLRPSVVGWMCALRRAAYLGFASAFGQATWIMLTRAV